MRVVGSSSRFGIFIARRPFEAAWAGHCANQRKPDARQQKSDAGFMDLLRPCFGG
jgi:hypothetical protein